MKFRTIVADPPWTYDGKAPFWDCSYVVDPTVERHYSALTVEQVCAFPVDRFADRSSFLWLWIPSEHFRRGVHTRVCEAWGFRVRGERVWMKNTFGMGYWFRYNHEYCVLATRGATGPLAERGIRSCVPATNDGHSQKPDAFYRDIEDACPGPYLELFARRPRPDQLDLTRDNVEWTVWGNEVGDPLGIGFDPKEWAKVRQTA